MMNKTVLMAATLIAAPVASFADIVSIDSSDTGTGIETIVGTSATNAPSSTVIAADAQNGGWTITTRLNGGSAFSARVGQGAVGFNGGSGSSGSSGISDLIPVDEELAALPEEVDDPNTTTEVSVVPLPAGIPLLLAGLGALGIAKRQRRKT